MTNKIKILLILSILFFICVPSINAKQHIKNTPILNNGKKWRIAYYEGGPYSEYTDTMKLLIAGLIDLGWIAEKNIPSIDGDIPKPYIDWLISHAGSYLSIKKEDCYSANWDDKKRKIYRDELIKKLKNKEIDLVIAMGTVAGLDLANNEHSIPVLVLSTSDPIGTGIIKSEKDSGFDHVTARVDPNRYIRQLRMFHRIVDFKKLGVVVEGEADTQNYSAIKDIDKISKERGFEYVICNMTGKGQEEFKLSCSACFEELSKKVDAVYVTAVLCSDTNTKEIADIFIKYKIPSFSMLGSKWVKDGILMSISSDSGYSALSKYLSDKFGKILNGAKPRDLNQLFEDPLDIAINLSTASQIGYKIPISILKISTEIYK